MNSIKQNWWKWVILTIIAAILFWGGLAIRLKVIGRTYWVGVGILLMTMGIIIFGTLLVVFVTKYLYSKPPSNHEINGLLPSEDITNNKTE